MKLGSFELTWGFSRRMTVAFVMGFSSGLPLLLLKDLLKAWMTDAGADLTVIGLATLVALPYNFKFVWAPLMDRLAFPFLGRRRGWLLVVQILLAGSIAALAFALTHYTKGDFAAAKRAGVMLAPWLVVYAAVAIAFMSASQDIVIDAYRREDLADNELGLGSSLAVNGYRVGMLVAGSGGLIMAGYFGSFVTTYFIMAGCMVVGVIATLLTPEPNTPPAEFTSLREAVFAPFLEYFARRGAVVMLAFILLYKIGDAMAASLLIPFYLGLGFTKLQIGVIGKLWGFWATIGGGFLGGVALVWLGIGRGLWVFGFLQAISTAGFALLAHVGLSLPMLTAVIAFENLASGMGTAAFVAFMAAQTDKRFTATQYALLTSLMAVPRDLAAAPAGFLAKAMGWEWFFIFCTIMAVPGMLLLLKFAPWGKPMAGLEPREAKGGFSLTPAIFARALGLGALAGLVMWRWVGPWMGLGSHNSIVMGVIVGLGLMAFEATRAGRKTSGK